MKFFPADLTHATSSDHHHNNLIGNRQPNSVNLIEEIGIYAIHLSLIDASISFFLKFGRNLLQSK